MITTNNGGFPWRGLPGSDEIEKGLRSRDSGTPAREGIGALQDRIARIAIDAQVDAGCDLATDGLARRADPMDDVVAGLGGLETGPERDGFPGTGGVYRVPVVRAEVGWKEPILAEHFLFGAAGAEGRLKAVLTGPYTIASLAEDHAYGEPMALAMALATALNQELRALQAAGAPWIQIDEPALPLRPEDFPGFTRIWEVLGRGVQARLALHLEGSAVAPLVTGLGRLKRLACLSVDCVTVPDNLASLAAATLPSGMAMGLGLLSGRTAEVEPAEEIAARIRAASGLPPADRLLIGTGTSLASLPLAAAIAKLRALDAARRLIAGS